MLESIQNALAQLHPFGWVMLFFFGFLYLFTMVYLLLFTGRIAFLKKSSDCGEEPLSLILTLRNEEENLRKNLPGLLTIENANYEVVAVDDFSQDNSLTILGAMKSQKPNLRFSSLNQETRYSEKMARNIALKAASYDWIMVIPPSTTKTGNFWPGYISSQMNAQTEVVVNYSNVNPGGTFFNLLFRVEFFFQQIKSFGFIISGLPFIVSEENVAFKKQKYFEAGGFRGKIAEPYANFELVVNCFIRKASTRLLLTGETAVYKTESISIFNYLELLKKEANLIQYLPFSKKFWLAVSFWIRLLVLPVAAFLIVLLPVLWPFVAAFLTIFILGYSFIIKRILNRLDEGKLFLPSLLFALLLLYFKLIFRAGYNYRSRKKRWKGKK